MTEIYHSERDIVMEREHLQSRLGFIFLSAGCAIGCGNVWKFPWMVGQSGGGAFVLVYLICLAVLGLPIMTMEFAVGRASQAGLLGMYPRLEKPGQKWHIHGTVGLIGNICLLAFYSVVTGWMICYFCRFVSGRTAGLSFGGMISSPAVNVTYLALTMIISIVILCFNLQKGLERVIKYMMSALLILILVLAVRSCLLDGAAGGIRFYLMPDFSKLTPQVIVSAMNQAFFTLSIGMGGVAIFGSYIDKSHSLMGESLYVILLDTFVAITAGLIIFPACFTYGVEVNAGPSLLFDTMAVVFSHMEGGRLWGSLFFLFMVFAALSTELTVLEAIIAAVREKTGWKRPFTGVVCGLIIFLLALTTALGFSVWHFQPFAEGTVWLDFWDFIVSTNILPLGSLCFALFCTTRIGWGWDSFVAEANAGKGLKIKAWMRPLFSYVVPAIILVLYIYGLVTFPWR